jgi:alanyl-tRNA synthetase
LTEAATKLKTRPADLASQIERLQDNLKQQEKLAQSLQEKLALASVPGLIEKAQQVDGVSFISAEVAGVSAEGLKTIAEDIRSRPGSFVILLASSPEPEKVSLVSAVSDNLVSRGVDAGAIVKETAKIVGGSGGGRKQLAQAGGKDTTKIRESLDHGKQVLVRMLTQNGSDHK